MIHRRTPIVGLALLIGVALILATPRLVTAADSLPDRLSDAAFWRLSEQLSEPNGSFRSDNLLSNELYYPEIMADLMTRVPSGRVYLGVGPEQNFNYIVALKPKMVFITDVRRGNLHLQLVYKALFELSKDRAEFVSRLFTKPRPAGLTEQSTIAQIVQAFWDVASGDAATFEKNLQSVKDQLTKAHGMPLSKEDLDGIDYVYRSFYWYGPSINYNSSNNGGSGRSSMTTYAQLMVATDDAGKPWSYLATEDAFRTLKDLEARNLLVPVVGNFGGARALKAVGQYVREHEAIVGAFYLSNVEQYLQQDGLWGTFCANVASMPLDESSAFIRSRSGGGGTFQNQLGAMRAETLGCATPAAPGEVR
ncbi:MAG: hypothetical protein ABI634_13925 [Acidobacteriota bacterium]